MKWFKRKERNRRFRRAHVLDVKLSAVQRRHNRLRRVMLLVVVACSVFIGLLVAWRGGEWVLRHFIYENPAFAIHHLEVETDGVIAIEQLRHWAGVRLNDNLWALDLSRVKRDLELMPIISSASLERVLPHTLRIHVKERQPIAMFVLPQVRAAGLVDRGTYYLDADGYVMFPLEPNQRSIPAHTNEHFPELVGLPLRELRPGRQVESPQAKAALQWIEAFMNSPMAGVAEIKQLDVGQPNILVLTTGQGSEITFGLSALETQIRRWFAISEHGQKLGKHLAAADLSVTNNIPTRWIEASLVPPATPKHLPTPRNRKKHV